MRAPGPDRDALDLGRFIEGIIAPQITAARQAILERFITADGYSTQTIGAAPPAGLPHTKKAGPCPIATCPWSHPDVRSPCPRHDGATLTTVERPAAIRCKQTDLAEGITDRWDGIDLAVKELARYLRTVMGAPIAEDITIPATPMCRDAQVGREGAAEWGDPLCPMPASIAGLCGAHYYAARRYKVAHGLRDTTTQPASDEHYPDGYRARGSRDPAA